MPHDDSFAVAHDGDGPVACCGHVGRIGSPSDGKSSSVGLEWEQTIIDARDPAALGRWWAEALGWVVVNDDPAEYEIRASPDRLPGLLFVPVPERKTIKNRLHLDFRPDDRDGEVSRLLALGATRADIGQGDESWVVLRDPEGNEFCVLRSRDVGGGQPP